MPVRIPGQPLGRSTLAMALLAIAGLTAPPAAAADSAHVLDPHGWVLSVGNWRHVPRDGGLPGLEPTTAILSYEFRDSTGYAWFRGGVPGTESPLADGSPSLALSPDGLIVLAWSRDNLSGGSDLVLAKWRNQAWALRQGELGVWEPDHFVLAEGGAAHNAEPDLVFDAEGNLYVAWRETEGTQRVRFAVLSPDVKLLHEETLSRAGATWTSPPKIALDGDGRLLVAFLSADESREPTLQVHSATDQGGGVIHVPNPIIELGRTETIPATLSGTALEGPEPSLPEVNVSTFIGTPVAWWIQDDEFGLSYLAHVTRSEDGDWLAAPVGQIALGPLGGEPGTSAIDAALGMVRDRLKLAAPLVEEPEPPTIRMPREFGAIVTYR